MDGAGVAEIVDVMPPASHIPCARHQLSRTTDLSQTLTMNHQLYSDNSHKEQEIVRQYCLQCFDTVCWTSGRASGSQKNCVMRCWCGDLSGARCILFADGPADDTAIPKPARKKQNARQLPISSPNVNGFSNFFSPPVLVVNLPQSLVWNIAPHSEHVATLLSEIWMSENWRRSEKCSNEPPTLQRGQHTSPPPLRGWRHSAVMSVLHPQKTLLAR